MLDRLATTEGKDVATTGAKKLIEQTKTLRLVLTCRSMSRVKLKD